MTTTITGVSDLRCEAAQGIEPTSLKLHVCALEVLDKAGKLLNYTADEYVAAVAVAQRKLGLPDVHTAMMGGASAGHV